MDNMTRLWIRACKSKNPILRCKSILRRYYLVKDENDISTAIIIHLSIIVDDYCPMTTLGILIQLEVIPKPVIDNRTFREKSRDMLISRILSTKNSQFGNGIFRYTQLR